MVRSILRNEFRKTAAELLGKEVTTNMEDLQELDTLSKELVSVMMPPSDKDNDNWQMKLPKLLETKGLNGNGSLGALKGRVEDLCRRLEASLEMESLLHGFSGGFIEPGPSGLITKGKIEVLPTGRNFYSLDPERFPLRPPGWLAESWPTASSRSTARSRGGCRRTLPCSGWREM